MAESILQARDRIADETGHSEIKSIKESAIGTMIGAGVGAAIGALISKRIPVRGMAGFDPEAMSRGSAFAVSTLSGGGLGLLGGSIPHINREATIDLKVERGLRNGTIEETYLDKYYAEKARADKLQRSILMMNFKSL